MTFRGHVDVDGLGDRQQQDARVGQAPRDVGHGEACMGAQQVAGEDAAQNGVEVVVGVGISFDPLGASAKIGKVIGIEHGARHAGVA